MAITKISNASLTGNKSFSVKAAGNNAREITVDVLLIAGGGKGGGNSCGGGGGAGGLREFTSNTLFSGEEFYIEVGAGGGSAFGKGNDSQFKSLISTGGGTAGSGVNVGGYPGGSGGGGGQNGRVGGSGNYPSVSPSQGNNGGTAGGDGGGGGGGHGAAGSNGGSNTGGAGGIGSIKTMISSANATTLSVGEISGTDVYYSGGGGGGAASGSALGGLGGGGNGTAGGGTAQNGQANTGGGGGGTRTGLRGDGGSGVAMIKYPSNVTATVGAGLTSSTVTEGAYNITVFTAGADFVSLN